MNHKNNTLNAVRTLYKSNSLHRDFLMGKWFFIMGMWMIAINRALLVWSSLSFRKDIDSTLMYRQGSFETYLGAILLCLGMLSLVCCIWINRKSFNEFRQFPDWAKVLFYGVILWSLITIIRSIKFDPTTLRDMFGITFNAWAWVVPLFFLFGTRMVVWKRIFKLAEKHAILGISLVSISVAFYSTVNDFRLSYGCGFMLLLLAYFKRKTRWIILIGTLTWLLSNLLILRRSFVLSYCILIVFAMCIHVCRSSRFRAFTQYAIILSAILMLSLISINYQGDSLSYLPERMNNEIVNFSEGLMENTRVGDGRNLYLEFLDDVRGFDFILGRGCMGKYFGKVGSNLIAGDARPNIECGYFQVVLKGGIVMLLLMLGLAVPTAWLGIFRSKNWFTRACGLFIVGWLLHMVPDGLPDTHLRYVLFWMAIGACWTKRLREIPEVEMKVVLSDR